MPADSRDDRWIERLLQQAGTTPGPDCLDAEMIAAWAEGGLGAAEMTAVERHASSCAHCLSVLAAMARTMPEPVPRRVRATGRVVRWLVPLTAAAAAVVLWIVVPIGPADSTVQRAAPESTILSVPEAPPSQTAPLSQTAPPPTRGPEVLGGAKQSTRTLPEAQPDTAPTVRDRADQALQEQQTAVDSRLLRSAVGARQNAEAPQPAPAAPPMVAGAVNEMATLAERPQGQGFAPLESSVPANRFVRWRVLGRRSIERSVDGGVTWIRTAVPDVVSAGTSPVTIINVLAIDPQTARITTSTGSVFSTSDAGATWMSVQEKPVAPF